MRQVGQALLDANVAVVYLAHGTFVGEDALGIINGLSRFFPETGHSLRQLNKSLTDRVLGETGNYTVEYAKLFEKSIQVPGQRQLPVRLFSWSSENHHIGRADGAVRLIAELAALNLEPGQRILLWGHSHAGNVFALASNLLSGDAETVKQFFDAAQVYYRWPLLGCVDIPLWRRVRLLLESPRRPLAENPMDIVTFGTPIRYGWDSGGYAKLLHFINHRPVPGLPEYRAQVPSELDALLTAKGGDYVQQLGIAGTNLVPNPMWWRTWLADYRLDRLLEPDTSTLDLPERCELGMRVPNEGTTLLVDYGEPDESVAKHHAGHAVYTQSKWMHFHAQQTAHEFYGLPLEAAPETAPNCGAAE